MWAKTYENPVEIPWVQTNVEEMSLEFTFKNINRIASSNVIREMISILMIHWLLSILLKLGETVCNDLLKSCVLG